MAVETTMLRIPPLCLVLLLPFCSCTQFVPTAQAGYAKMSLSGDVALNSSGSSLIDQDIDSALGLGEDQGSPYGRLQFDFGVPVLTVSGFSFDERGRGTLNADFGNVSAGRDVDTDFSVTNIKGSLAFAITLGPVSVQPGIAIDWFDLHILVEDVGGFASEEVDLQAPVPMAFVRGDVDLGIVGLVGEVGYLTVPSVDDFEGEFWDLEAMVELRPTDSLNLFAGYRSIILDVQGTSDNEDYDINLDISGFVIGGGFRF